MLGVWVGFKLQALVYDILPSTTAVFSYVIGSWKLSTNEQFFVCAQTVVSLLQTVQIKQGVWFIAANKVYTSTNKTTIVWIETELFFFLIKVLLMMKYNEIVPSLRCITVNPKIDLSDLRSKVNHSAPWLTNRFLDWLWHSAVTVQFRCTSSLTKLWSDSKRQLQTRCARCWAWRNRCSGHVVDHTKRIYLLGKSPQNCCM